MKKTELVENLGPFMQCLMTIVNDSNQFREDNDKNEDIILYRPLFLPKSDIKNLMIALEGKNVQTEAPCITIDGVVSALPNKFVAEAYILNAICHANLKKKNGLTHDSIINLVKHPKEKSLLPIMLRILQRSSFDVF